MGTGVGRGIATGRLGAVVFGTAALFVLFQMVLQTFPSAESSEALLTRVIARDTAGVEAGATVHLSHDPASVHVLEAA